jgi:fused signal recognition particle receptor
MRALFDTFKRGFDITRTALSRSLQGLFVETREWTAADYERLEAALIGADLGVAYTTRLLDDVRDRYRRGQIKTADDIIRVAREDVVRIMGRDVAPPAFAANGPTVILLVGVNGTGKTTTAGKLGKLYRDSGKTVLLAAGDTFRAAATEQLKIWGQRSGVPVTAGNPGADAAAVAFDACQAAIARRLDVVLIDTAGRQHTKKGLMDELAKIRRTVGRACPGAPHESWLVVDGSAGSNGLVQAREFGRATPLTGLCVTKLDGTSKGGIVVAIHQELGLPVRFVGLGEAVADLQPFDARMFAEAIFPAGMV